MDGWPPATGGPWLPPPAADRASLDEGAGGLGANADDAFPAERDVWYLEVVGVHPDEQGAGIGSRLVGTGLERADATGAASYLETPSAANVRFYERLGFEVERDGVELLPGGPTHWLMRRPAKRAS